MGQCERFYKDLISPDMWAGIYDGLAGSGSLPASFPGVEAPSLPFFVDLMTSPDTHAWALSFERELAGLVYLTDVQGTSARIHFAFLPTKATRTKADKTRANGANEHRPNAHRARTSRAGTGQTGTFLTASLQAGISRAETVPAGKCPAGQAKACERLPVPVAIGRFAVASILRDRYSHGASGPGEHILDTLVGLTPVGNAPAVNLILRCGATALGVIPAACPDRAGRNTAGLLTYFTRESTDDSWTIL